jgi:hypothetical protein
MEDGLLGMAMDPEERKRLMLGHTLLGISAGLFNSNKGNIFGSAGSGMLAGVGQGMRAVSDANKERALTANMALQNQKMKREMRLQDLISGELGGEQPAGAPPPLPGAFPAPGSAASQFGLPPQAPAAPSAPTTRRTLLQVARERGVEEPVRLALASGTTEGLTAAAKIVAEASKPQTLKPGDQQFSADGKLLFSSPNVPTGMRVGPGGSAEWIPEYLDRQRELTGATAGATAGAQAQYDLVEVPIGNNQKVMMPRAQAAQMLRQQQGGQQAPRVEMDRPPTPQELAWMQSQMPQGAPQGAPAQGGFGVTPNPLVQREQEQKITTQGAQDTAIATTYAKDFTDLITAERSAPGNVARYELLKSHLSKVDTGKLAPTVQSLKAVAAYVAPDLAKEWTQGTPYAQAAGALVNEMALQLRSPAGGAGMPGAMSDADREFLVNMTANVQNDPRAIPIMLDAKIAIEKRNAEIGKMARDYRRKNGKIDDGFYEMIREHAESRPLFKDAQQPAPTGDGGSRPLTAAEQARLQYLQKKHNR